MYPDLNKIVKYRGLKHRVARYMFAWPNNTMTLERLHDQKEVVLPLTKETLAAVKVTNKKLPSKK